MLQAGPEFDALAARTGLRRRRPDRASGPRRTRGDCLTITLNRPGRHNAVDRAMRDGLADALTLAAARRSVNAVELRGNGPSFCSGGDLDEFGSFPDPAPPTHPPDPQPARLGAPGADRLEVHLHGACMGAGIELPAFAGRVVAAPTP